MHRESNRRPFGAINGADMVQDRPIKNTKGRHSALFKPFSKEVYEAHLEKVKKETSDEHKGERWSWIEKKWVKDGA